ncbi:hypothetical protein B0H14DRAFT_2931033 [Mycena olivaceomarginata]|nr:hypothetical protein B0H14DRAFT_2931033 [Mycena olivaceomarginata]
MCYLLSLCDLVTLEHSVMETASEDMYSNELRDSFGRGKQKTLLQRLTTQHRMWKLLIGGLYPPALQAPVAKALGGVTPIILDAGCGSAACAHVVGVDLACVSLLVVLWLLYAPFRFIQTDLSEGLPACRDPAGYDLIPCPLPLKDPAAFMRHVENALKPGGIFIVGDFCLDTFDRDKDLDGAWFAGWQELWVKGHSRKYTRSSTRFWNCGALSPIFSRKYFCPVGWAGDDVENGAELGDIMLQNTKQFVRAGLPALLGNGKFSREQLEFWIDAMEDEFKTKKMYFTLDFAAAVKAPQILVRHRFRYSIGVIEG